MGKLKIVIATALLAILTSCTPNNVVIVQGLSQTEANDLFIRLSNEKITAAKQADKDGTFSILVEKNSQLSALRVLSSVGAPRDKYTSLGDVFKKDGLISSPLEEYARYTYALDQDLQQTISLIDGVLAVRVHVSIPAPSDNLWSSEHTKPSAAVFIKYKLGYRIDLLTNRIKLLVSKAVPGLTPDMVEILPLQRRD